MEAPSVVEMREVIHVLIERAFNLRTSLHTVPHNKSVSSEGLHTFSMASLKMALQSFLELSFDIYLKFAVHILGLTKYPGFSCF